MLNIAISDNTLSEILKLQALECGRNGNFSRIEDRVSAFRYRVYDITMTEIMQQIKFQQSVQLLK